MAEARPNLLPAVVLVRPMGPDDPALAADGQGPILPRLLARLREQKQVGPVLVSAPRGLPEEQAVELASWAASYPIEIDFSEHDLPQARLAQAMGTHGWGRMLVLSGYNHFMDATALAELAQAMQNGSDAAHTPGAGPAKYLPALSRESVSRLAGLANPLAPRTMVRDLLSLHPQARVHEVHGVEGPGEGLLWDLLRPQGSPWLGAERVARFVNGAGPESWFTRQAFAEFLDRELGIAPESGREVRERLDRLLAVLPDCGRAGKLSGQLDFLRGLCPHLPQQRRVFVELGCGAGPLASLLLGRAFGRGLALDRALEKTGPEQRQAVAELARFLAERVPGLVPEALRQDGGPDSGPNSGLDLRTDFLEDLGLEDGSVDLICSRTVLEHVADVEALSREMVRVLAPGGVLFHEIDFRDHRGSSGVHFDFLRHSPEEWAAMGQSTNLWRVNDFDELWRSMGLEVQVESRTDTDRCPARLHPCWQGYDRRDLLCHTATIRARKA